jgi:hypothetical protein
MAGALYLAVIGIVAGCVASLQQLRWAGIDHNISIITLELPRHQPGARAWAANRDALMAALDGEPK